MLVPIPVHWNTSEQPSLVRTVPPELVTTKIPELVPVCVCVCVCACACVCVCVNKIYQQIFIHSHALNINVNKIFMVIQFLQKQSQLLNEYTHLCNPFSECVCANGYTSITCIHLTQFIL